MQDNQPETPQQQPPALPAPKHVDKRDHVLPNSVHGDQVWQMCQPIIDWLLTYGDQEMKAIALEARAYWEQNQHSIIDWANSVQFFTLAQMAVQDIQRFRLMLKSVPPQTEMQTEYYPDGQEEPILVDTIAWLALKAGERVNTSLTPTGKIITGVWKRKKGKRG